MNLMRASNEWANRPADERFWNLPELIQAADRFKHGAKETVTAPSAMEVVAQGSDLRIVNRASPEKGAYFTHYSFGQTCSLLRTPAGFVRELTAPTAATVINERLKGRDSNMNMLWNTGNATLRAMTSEKYGRIWNADIAKRVLPLTELGWRNPPARPSTADDNRARPATAADVLQSRFNQGGGLAINEGDLIAPAGLYLSEKDMFLFLVNETRPINGGGTTPMYRGFFLENSEVGDRSFRLTTFLYNTVCGNHIVWGAKDVENLRIVHMGDKAEGKAFNGLRVELQKYCESSATDIEARIKSAKTVILGATKDEVVNALLFTYKLKGAPNITESLLCDAYSEAEKHPEDGGNAPASSAWGMVQGMTRLSQKSEYADTRVEIDRAASKILTAAVPF